MYETPQNTLYRKSRTCIVLIVKLKECDAQETIYLLVLSTVGGADGKTCRARPEEGQLQREVRIGLASEALLAVGVRMSIHMNHSAHLKKGVRAFVVDYIGSVCKLYCLSIHNYTMDDLMVHLTPLYPSQWCLQSVLRITARP